MKLVFVSSTFKDMQFERDALHNLAAPKIDDSLSKYGEKIYFGDLRWGVNTTALDSEEGSKRVLQVCLDEIDDCKPYMIVLIGERYGWIPDGELISRAAAERGIDVPSDISVTQLEIEYGALSNAANDGRVLFYFRELDKSGMTEEELVDYNSETELHREKIDALKKKIRELYPENVRTYTAKWDKEAHAVTEFDGFLETVERDLTKLISTDIDADMSLPWQERAMNSAHRYFLDNEKHYAEIEREAKDLFCGPFAENDCRMLFIKGGVGTGKTAYISHLYGQTVNEEGRDAVLPFVFGLDQYSGTVMDYFKILLYVIEKRAGFSHYETQYGVDGIDTEVFKLIFSYEGLSGSLIHSFIDNCSYELQNALSVHLLDSHIKNAHFDYFNSAECLHEFFDFKIAYAAGEDDVMLPPWFDFSNTTILSKIKTEEVAPLVKALLKRKHKELAAPVIEAIAQKEEAVFPTYLGLVTERLLMLDSRDFAEIRRMGDGMDNINKYQLSLVERLPDTADGMTVELVNSVAERVNHDLVMRTLALLVYSGVTLFETEIREMFDGAGWEFSSLDFALATRSLTSVIKYDPREKTYSIKNPQVISALTEFFEKKGFTYVASALFEILADHRSIMTRLGEARFNAASYEGRNTLVIAMADSYRFWHILPGKLEQLLKQHGAEYMAYVLCDLVRSCDDLDWSYLIEHIPTICTTNSNYRLYYEMLDLIYEDMLPNAMDPDNIVCNSFFTVVFCKLVHFKMRVNASEAAPFYYAYHTNELDKFPINDRARVNYEITRLRFVGKECYQTMGNNQIDFDLIEISDLINSENFPLPDEQYIFRANLNAAFIYYVEHSFDLRYYNPEFLAGLRKSVMDFYITLCGNLKDGICAITSDDVATMIDTALGDKKDYAEIDYKRLCNTLDFMYTGQTYVDSRLNKYLPHILEASRFSLDGDEWDDAPADPVNLYKRIVAYSRAIAGTSSTLDECLNATINIGYAVDVLAASDEIEWEDFAGMLSDLYRFIRISLDMSNGEARVFYRLFMPISYYLSALRVYGIEEYIEDMCTVLSNLEINDKNAPLFPELFVGSLIYAYAQRDNEELRLELREMKDGMEDDPDYAPYFAAYTPELMYIDVNLQSEEESAAELADFNFSEDGEWDLNSINLDLNIDWGSDDDDSVFDEEWDGDDESVSDDDFGSDVTDDSLFDIGKITPDVLRVMLEEQGVDSAAISDEMLLNMMKTIFGDVGDDGAIDLDYDSLFEDEEADPDSLLEDEDMVNFDSDDVDGE